MKEKVTIIIPTKDEQDVIGKCLNSFIEQTYDKELIEIFVCDGISKDSTRNIVKQYMEKYNNIKLVDNHGIFAPNGMNEGIKQSKGEIIIIFGAHAYADKNFIKYNVENLQDKNIGCSGGVIETINDNNKGIAISQAMSSPFGVGNALFRYSQDKQYVDTVAFGAYRKRILDKIGYFDEELVRNQDDELNFRVIKNNYKILLDPRIRSKYYSRSSLKKLWKQYFQYGFWKVKVVQKHGEVASIRHLVPLAFVLSNLIGIIGSIFFKFIRNLWFLEILIYIFLNIIFSFKQGEKNMKIIKYKFLIFPILHISYGVGFLDGLINFYILKSKKVVKRNVKISR